MPEPALFLTQDQAAAALFVSARTLVRWRLDGRGPRFCRIGQRVAYRQSDIDTWASQHSYATRSEELEALR